MAYQRITIDGEAFNVIGLQIKPWLPYNPAAEVVALPVLAACRFDISGRDPENDEAFTFNGLEAVDSHNWPPTEFRSTDAPATRPRDAQQGKKRATIDFAHW